MGEIEWAMWANEQAIISGFMMLVGGITGVTGVFRNWQFAAYSIVASLLIILLEYPRGRRKKGTTKERRYQIYLTKVLDKMGPVTSNYYVRFVLHLLLCVPCCFVLPTLIGGVFLAISSVTYLVAALKGEKWLPLSLDTRESRSASGSKAATSQPPSKPPPRAPNQQAEAEDMDPEQTRY